MKKELLIISFLLLLSFNIFSVQANKTDYTTNPNETISFVTTFNSISNTGISNLIEKYSVSALEPYNKQFLTAAVVFTVCTAVFLVVGIVGSVLWYVGTPWPTNNYIYNPGLMWAGYALMGVGWGFFSITVLGMIAFWILYGLSGGPKAAMNNKIRIEGASFVVKL